MKFLSALFLMLSASIAHAEPQFREGFYCIGNAKEAINLRLQIADKPEKLAHGLMHRRTLKPFDGMYFDFGEPRPVSMWMKNTFIPLDMLFLDKDGRVVQIIKDTVPHSEAIILSEHLTLTVIELEAGRADKEGFQLGDKVQQGTCAIARAG